MTLARVIRGVMTEAIRSQDYLTLWSFYFTRIGVLESDNQRGQKVRGRGIKGHPMDRTLAWTELAWVQILTWASEFIVWSSVFPPVKWG